MSDGDVVASEATSVIEQTPAVNDVVTATEVEKQVSQSTVNALIGNAKRDSYEKGRKEALASTPSNPEPTSVVAPVQAVTQDDIVRMVDEAASKKADEAYAQKTVETFIRKVESGKAKYDDYETSVAQLNIPAVPQMVPLLNELDNTDEVLYELAKNTGKYAEVLTLMNSSPALAKSRLEQLSKSITANQKAVSSTKSVPEPLSKIKPSLTATDNGEMTISELRKLPQNRRF